MPKLLNVIQVLEKLAEPAPDLLGTAKILFEALAEENIPAIFCGGFAMHVYGGRRTTEDVDLIVPGEYAGKMDELLWKTLKPKFPGATMKFTCKQTGVDVDVIYAGKKMNDRMHTLPPEPKKVVSKPKGVTVEQLITMKLDSYQATPLGRNKDLTDIIDLIKIKNLPREVRLVKPIKKIYEGIWDGLKAEG